jgi:hypothetical protein
MIFANLCQLRDQTRRQIMATLLLIVFSFSILSACSDNDQAERPVGELYNQHERGRVLRPQHQQSHPNQRVNAIKPVPTLGGIKPPKSDLPGRQNLAGRCKFNEKLT